MNGQGRLLFTVLPSIELAFEPGWLKGQPAVVELPPEQAYARLEELVRAVFRTFARAGHALVICLDDLQWCSPLDLNFILSLVGRADEPRTSSPVLVVCIYRDTAVGSDHIITTNLLPNVRIDLIITVPTFTIGDVIDFVGDTLHRSVIKIPTAPLERECETDVRELAQCVLVKTAGNPFFTHTVSTH